MFQTTLNKKNNEVVLFEDEAHKPIVTSKSCELLF